MKKYIVVWRDIDEENGVTVCETDDRKEAYDYALKKLPCRKEAIVYSDGEIQYQGMKA